MLRISSRIVLPADEVELRAIRAQGAGGQNVNKVASAVHLTFDIAASSLPDAYKTRLLAKRDRRITREGVVVIKAQQHRGLEQNRAAALERLRELIQSVAVTRKPRVATQPTKASQARRLEGKTQRAKVKQLRARVDEE